MQQECYNMCGSEQKTNPASAAKKSKFEIMLDLTIKIFFSALRILLGVLVVWNCWAKRLAIGIAQNYQV